VCSKATRKVIINATKNKPVITLYVLCLLEMDVPVWFLTFSMTHTESFCFRHFSFFHHFPVHPAKLPYIIHIIRLQQMEVASHLFGLDTRER